MTYHFHAVGGLCMGAISGAITGGTSAKMSLLQDLYSKRRIEYAVREYESHMLKREMEASSHGESIMSFESVCKFLCLELLF